MRRWAILFAGALLALASSPASLVLPAAVLAGCGSCAAVDRRIDAATVRGPLERVLARTEAYLAADPSVEPPELGAFQARAEALSQLVRRERILPGELEAAGLLEVVAEHDGRVLGDPTLLELERRVYLGDSEAVVRVAAAARGG